VASLADRADAFLDLLSDTADELGLPLPDRQYVAAGAAGAEAWDTEQVTVALVTLDPAPASQGTAGQVSRTGQHPGGVSVSSVTLRAEIVRYAPSLLDDERIPTPQQMHAYGRRAMADAELLRTVLVRAQRTMVLTDGTGSVRIGQVTTSGPEGGYAGAAASITFDLL